MWQHLPFELKAEILSHVPLSNTKLAARVVSKEWLDLLDFPGSHASHEKSAGGIRLSSRDLVSTKLLRPLTWIRVRPSGVADPHLISCLPSSFKALQMSSLLTHLDLGSLPLPVYDFVFHSLQALTFGLPEAGPASTQAEFAQPALKLKYFPALRSAVLTPAPDQRFRQTQLERLFRYAAGLRLQNVHILGRLQTCPNFCLPPDCSLNISASWRCWTASRLGTATRHITGLQLHVRQMDALGGREYVGIANVSDSDELIVNVAWVFETFPKLVDFSLLLRGAHEQSWLLAGIHGSLSVAANEAQMLPSYRMENLTSHPGFESQLRAWAGPYDAPSWRTVMHLQGSEEPLLAVDNLDTSTCSSSSVTGPM